VCQVCILLQADGDSDLSLDSDTDAKDEELDTDNEDPEVRMHNPLFLSFSSLPPLTLLQAKGESDSSVTPST
jgi:hypothetical protein